MKSYEITHGVERHALSAICGDMDEAQLLELAEDIKANGQKDTVVMFEGQVLDGWHRLQACQINQMPCRATDYQGTDPAAYVESKNLHRRNQTASQRAAIIVALREWRGRGRPKAEEKSVTMKDFSQEKTTNAAMARDAGVSVSTIERAKRAQRAGNGEAVAKGEVPAHKAGNDKPAEKKPSKVERLQAQVEEYRARMAELEQSIDDLTDELKIAQAAELEETEQIAELRKAQAYIRTLESQCREYQNEANQWKREAKGLRRKLDG